MTSLFIDYGQARLKKEEDKMEYNFFGPEEEFNPKYYSQNNEIGDYWDFGTKLLAADIGLIDLSPSPTTLKLRKSKPR